MRRVMLIIAAAALVGTIAPSVMYLAGRVSKDSVQWLMLAATIVWFAAAPFCGRGTKATTAPDGDGDA